MFGGNEDPVNSMLSSINMVYKGPLSVTLPNSINSLWKPQFQINMSMLMPKFLLQALKEEHIPTMVIQPLFDNVTLQRLQAWPKPFPSTSSWRNYVESFYTKLKRVMKVR